MKNIQLAFYFLIVQAPAIYAQSWSLTGNSGTNPATNFLGTSDAKPLIFKVNKIQSAYLSNDTVARKTSFGYQALLNATGSANSAFGYKALFSDSTGYYNTALGALALSANKTGNINTAIGFIALTNNISGSGNTATGYSSLFLNTGGSNNTANGHYSLAWNNTGASNTAMGDHSLSLNRTGSYNTAYGAYSLFYNTAGGNTASGYKSLYSNTTGYSNTAAGFYALYLNKTGSYNTAGGDYALFNSTGSWNTAYGANALLTNTIGFANTAMGQGADVAAANLNNAMALGYAAKVNASNKVAIGNSSVSVIGGQVGWSTFSDGRFKKNIKENVPGLAFINKLKPVTYNVEVKKIEQFLGVKDSTINATKDAYNAAERKLRTGFVAQEVEKAAQSINYDFDGVNHPQNEKDNYSLVYADFVPSLVKAVQELSKMNDEKDALIVQLNERLIKLEQSAIINSNVSVTSNDKFQMGSSTAAKLEQNMPNPFNQSTVIRFLIPSITKQAQIIITDMSGKTVKHEIINAKENGQININAGELAAGTYSYTLYVDGKRIDTKQMVRLAKY